MPVFHLLSGGDIVGQLRLSFRPTRRFKLQFQACAQRWLILLHQPAVIALRCDHLATERVLDVHGTLVTTTPVRSRRWNRVGAATLSFSF